MKCVENASSIHVRGKCTEHGWNMNENNIMKYARNMVGICMEGAWDMHGRCIKYAWDMHVTRAQYAWNTRGICMGYAWNMHAICMESPEWNEHM